MAEQESVFFFFFLFQAFSFLVKTSCLHYPQCNDCGQFSQRFRCVTLVVLTRIKAGKIVQKEKCNVLN